MRLTRVLFMVVAMAGLARANPVITFLSTGTNSHTGSISYAGSGAAAIGTNIDIDSIGGVGTLANAGVTRKCFGCVLSFQTGSNISDTSAQGTAWSFNGGGFFQVYGSFDLNGNHVFDTGDIPANTLLLNGIFNVPVTVTTPSNSTGFIKDFNITAGTLINRMDNQLDAFFGLGTTSVYAGVYQQTFVTTRNQYAAGQWSFDTYNSHPAGVPGMMDGSIVNTLSVPEPLSVLLFGTTGAILAFVAVRRHRKA